MSSWAESKAILAFVCNWDPHDWYLDRGGANSAVPPFVRPVRLMCAGRVDPAIVLLAFEKGAEGVIVLSCAEKGCRYGPGPVQAQRTEGRIKGLLHILGLEPGRFTILTCLPQEPERLSAQMAAFARKVSRLDRSPLAR